MEQVDRKAIIKGDLTIWLKNEERFLNEKWEFCPVKNIGGSVLAITEKDNKCYVALPLSGDSLCGMIYETRDSFDELIAQYEHSVIKE